MVQPAPSLRFVQSGTSFTELKPLPFEQQHVQVQAQMNYRKRGLRYFSGFDFALSADYAALNREGHDIDVAFIFPIEVDKSQVLLSDLSFLVNGVESDLDLGESGNRLVWTGRIPQGATGRFSIRYRARGLDSFLYKLDPCSRPSGPPPSCCPPPPSSSRATPASSTPWRSSRRCSV